MGRHAPYLSRIFTEAAQVTALAKIALRGRAAPERPYRARATPRRGGASHRMTGGEQHLCLTCGLCCDGSLFWAVPVEAGENPPVPLDAERRLCQPCARFDGACTIYADRPKACRSFDCRVLLALQAGQRNRAWAEGQIAGMRRILAALDAALPGTEPSIYRRAAEFLARHRDRIADPAFQRRHRKLLQTLSAYEKALAAFQIPAGQRRRYPTGAAATQKQKR